MQTKIGDLDKLDYNELISIVKETNRPPGGKNTVFEIINRLMVSQNTSILEIGTSTGFTAIEISRFVKSKITSVDINELSLKEAGRRAKGEGYTNIQFVKADVTKLPFENESFDVVIVGNVLSLLQNREKAIKECMRVCKKDGFIVAIPMYYLKRPTKKLVNDVSNALKVKITPLYKKDWVDFFSINSLEIYWSKNFKFDYIKDKVVTSFVDSLVNKSRMKDIDSAVLPKLHVKYKKYMLLFRDNLSIMGYTILILSKHRVWEDPELYTSTEI